ncbi:hypothetical protein AB0O22_23355 [Streptomyces sp. NPDC091204]
MILNASADIEVVAATGGGQAPAAVARHAPEPALLDMPPDGRRARHTPR